MKNLLNRALVALSSAPSAVEAVLLLLTFIGMAVWSNSLLAAPAVTLTATPTTGISPLPVTLTWSATEFPAGSTCVASGAWTGAKETSGTVTLTVNGGNFTYTLSCSAPTGTETLTWPAVTRNVDESVVPATGPGSIAAYKVFVAQTEAAVGPATPVVLGADARSYTFASLPVGTNWYSIRAVNVAGVESDLAVDSKSGKFLSSVVVAPSVSASAAVVVNVKPKPPAVKIAVSTTAYELDVTGSGRVKLGRAVGTVPLGTACGQASYQTRWGVYTEVPREAVTLSKQPKSEAVVAECA